MRYEAAYSLGIRLAETVMQQRHSGVIRLAVPLGSFDWGTRTVNIQTDGNHHPSLLPLLGVAIIVLLVFVWTYVR